MTNIQDIHTDEKMRFAYNEGRAHARAFRADPYAHVYQDVFRAETAEYRISVEYDDVEGISYLYVNFKDRGPRGVGLCFEFDDRRKAITRALRFVAEHPAPSPVCHIDY